MKIHLPAGISSLFTAKRLAIAGLAVITLLVVTSILTYSVNAREISDPTRLMNHNSSGIALKDRNGKIFYEYGAVNDGAQKNLTEISDSVEQALLAAEDRGFYEHPGYSIRGIAGAVRDNVLNKDATSRGGSTITQQLVKNKLLTTEKSFLRKYQEITMAVAVERRYSKDEILSMYLNSVYFGEGAFGITEAAKTYFGTTPDRLTSAQSAMLVGLLPAPSSYSPINGDPNLAKRQQDRVLTAMVEAGYLDDGAKQAALDEPLEYTGGNGKSFNTAQHFTRMVIDELNDTYGEEKVVRSGFIVTTTLDSGWQAKAEQSVRDYIAQFSSRGGRNAGLVAIDPKTGEIRALVGSVDWNNEQFGKVNMVVSPRQPGSSFKPLYYAEALDKRLITPATVMQDEPKTYGGTYKPENYDFRFRGDITIRNALAQSLNIPAVDVMQKLGPDSASTAAQRMGVRDVNEPEKYGLSLALGTAEVKLLEMTNAYAAFANQGKQYEPVLITSIKKQIR